MNVDFREGDLCEFCSKGNLVVVEGRYPYTVRHLQCPLCDSTYCLEEKDDDRRFRRSRTVPPQGGEA